MENASSGCFSISLRHSIPLIAIFCSQNWNFWVSVVFVYNGLKVDWLKINKLYIIPAILIPVQLKNNICLWRCIDFEIVLYHTLCLYVEYAVLCGNKVLLNFTLNLNLSKPILTKFTDVMHNWPQ